MSGDAIAFTSFLVIIILVGVLGHWHQESSKKIRELKFPQWQLVETADSFRFPDGTVIAKSAMRNMHSFKCVELDWTSRSKYDEVIEVYFKRGSNNTNIAVAGSGVIAGGDAIINDLGKTSIGVYKGEFRNCKNELEASRALRTHMIDMVQKAHEIACRE